MEPYTDKAMQPPTSEELERWMEQKTLRPEPLNPGRRPSEENGDDWLVTYADAVTIILAFFVLIFSVSEVRQQQFESLQTSLGQTLLHKKEVKNPLNDLQLSLSGILQEHRIDPLQAITVTDHELKIDLPGELLFKSASTDLEPESVRLIENLAQKIKQFPLQDYAIEIEGHTDDVPISTVRYPSNWQLSSGRAISVLSLFFKAGIDSDRLKAVGYADTRPKAPNRDLRGQPIDENRAQNRRVEIKVAKIAQ